MQIYPQKQKQKGTKVLAVEHVYMPILRLSYPKVNEEIIFIDYYILNYVYKMSSFILQKMPIGCIKVTGV